MMTKDANELFQSFFAICILLVPVFGDLDKRCTPDTPRHGHICGNQINEVLDSVCSLYGGFSDGHKKRSGIQNHVYNVSIHNLQTPQIKPDEKPTNLIPETSRDLIPDTPRDRKLDKPRAADRHLLSRQMAHRFLSKRNGYSQGIVCECCYHRCSVSEIREYCSFSNSDPDTNLFNNI